jgi:hypothetical protein
MGKAENDQLRASSNASLANSLPPRCGKEHRKETRYMVSWRAAVSIDGQTFHYGRLKDISLHGAAILNDLNVKPGACVTLKIHIPTLDRSCESKVMMVRGKTAYTVCDATPISGSAFISLNLGRHRIAPIWKNALQITMSRCQTMYPSGTRIG